jgi:NAD+ kinase
LSVDHNLSLRNDVVSVRTMVSTQKVRFARYRPFPFWDRVREAFIGFEEK